MSKFPIAEQIRHGHPVVLPQWWPQEDMLNGAIDWRERIADAALFDVSVASELYWTGNKDQYALAEDFGPLRPPYPVMWMEWAVPKGATITNPIEGAMDIKDLIGCRSALLLHTQEYHPYIGTTPPLARVCEEEEVTVVAGHMLTQAPGDDRIIYVPVITMMAVDNHTGRYVEDSHQAAGDQRSLDKLNERFEQDFIERVTKADLNVAYMALNLMNCRNVSTPQTGVAYARTGREKRQRIPVTRYHTIQLPGMAQKPGRHGRRSRSDEAVMAIHRVRGHFKTYTPEAPLLGKHVGTYWWGWNVRGSSKHGVVVSDYQFKEGA